MGIGTLLRQARQARRLSQQEVAEHLRLPVAYIQAMEEERWADLPGGYYRQAFVRTYATWLGVALPPGALQALSGEAPEDRRRTARAALGTGVRQFWWAGVVSLTLVASWAWWHLRRSVADAPPVLTGRPPAVSVPAPRLPDERHPPTPAPLTPLRLRVVAEENCWLEIYADGHRVFLGTLRAGEAYRVEARTRIRLATVGNAGALRVFLNDRPVPPLGELGETRQNVVFDANRLSSDMPRPSESGTVYNESGPR